MKDVARAAGVSSATVSYVLNNLGKVTQDVDAHVRKTALEIGYSRNTAATALKTGRHNVIGCIVPTLLSPVFPEIMKSIQTRARELGFATFVVESEIGGEAEAARVLASHGVDGAIAILEARPKIVESPLFPIVVMDRSIEGLDSVQADHFQGGVLMAQHALDLGRLRIGLVSGEEAFESSRLRRDGFLSGINGKADIVWEERVPLDAKLTTTAHHALGRKDVDFIACVNDLVAMAVLSALRQHRILVPDEVSVVGFDNVTWADWPIFDLTTVSQSLSDLGREAVDLMVRRLSHPQARPQHLVLPVQLIKRGSSTTR